MIEESDADLPLHDEARARAKWRGGETILDKEESGTAGPASEIDDASEGGQQARSSGDRMLKNAGQSPPD